MKIKSLKIIINQLKKTHPTENFDLIVGITNGGIVPAYLVSSYLKLPLEYMGINFRDKLNKPSRSNPKLTKKPRFVYKNKTILLVDDRSNSGKTLEFAKKKLSGTTAIKTLVFNGKADYQLFDEACFQFPWEIKN